MMETGHVFNYYSEISVHSSFYFCNFMAKENPNPNKDCNELLIIFSNSHLSSNLSTNYKNTYEFLISYNISKTYENALISDFCSYFSNQFCQCRQAHE